MNADATNQRLNSVHENTANRRPACRLARCANSQSLGPPNDDNGRSARAVTGCGAADAASSATWTEAGEGGDD
eukprot:6328322-Pyramimonas_sp.AAC.2